MAHFETNSKIKYLALSLSLSLSLFLSLWFMVPHVPQNTLTMPL